MCRALWGSPPDSLRFRHGPAVPAHWAGHGPGPGLGATWGGMAGPGFAFSDLWAFDLSGHTWRELLQTGAKPPARGDHVAVLDPASGAS